MDETERAHKADKDRRRKEGRELAEAMMPHCVHCGMPFNPVFSSGRAYGICQDCIDNRS